MSSQPRLWPFKAFYFGFFAAGAALFPYLALYYESQGFRGSQIGILTAIPPLISLVAAASWGGLADATRRHRLILSLAILGTVGFSLGIWGMSTFYGVMVMVIGFAFLIAPIIPMVDSSAMETLASLKNQYGKLRLWGAVGWGLLSPIAGRIVEQFGLNWSFFGYAIMMSMLFVIAFALPVSQRTSIGQPFWRGVGQLIHMRQWPFFLLLVFMIGIGIGVVQNFLFLYMKQLGASTTLMGISLTVATVSEIFFFSYADRLTTRLGTRTLLYFALGVTGLRLLAHFFIHNPIWVLPVQLTHGISFSLMWTAGVGYAADLAPDGLGATAQGVFSGVSMGIAAAVGSLLGGLLYETVGPFWMFGSVGLGMLLSLPLLIFLAPAEEPIDVPV